MLRSSSNSSLINSRRNNVFSQSSAIPWTAQNCYPCLGHSVTYVLAINCYLCLGHGPIPLSLTANPVLNESRFSSEPHVSRGSLERVAGEQTWHGSRGVAGTAHQKPCAQYSAANAL